MSAFLQRALSKQFFSNENIWYHVTCISLSLGFVGLFNKSSHTWLGFWHKRTNSYIDLGIVNDCATCYHKPNKKIKVCTLSLKMWNIKSHQAGVHVHISVCTLSSIFIQENTFANVVCLMSTILCKRHGTHKGEIYQGLNHTPLKWLTASMPCIVRNGFDRYWLYIPKYCCSI